MQGEGWREDATNSEAFCLRNRLRLELLARHGGTCPRCRGAQGSCGTFAGQRSSRMLEDMETDFCEPRTAAGRALPLAALRTLHPVMQGRVLRRWWGELAAELPRLEEHQTAAFMALIMASAGSRCNLPGDWHGERGSCFLHLVPPTVARVPGVVLDGTPCTIAWGRLTLTVRAWRSEDGHGDGKRVQVLPAAFLAGCILRTREPGDWLRPFGGGGRKSLQDALTDRK